MNGMKYSSVLILAINSLLVLSCTDFDPFGMDRRTINSSYQLYLFDEPQRYYVIRHGQRLPDNVFGGSVLKIGWSSDYILAFVDKAYEGDVDGWYSLTFASGEIKGPISESTITNSPELSVIRVMPSNDAFQAL